MHALQFIDSNPLRGKLSWWMLLCCLLGLLAVMHFNSFGTTRGGDDEGSGIGGTGRLPQNGESGLGGTGLRPFVTINPENEVEVRLHPRPDRPPVVARLSLDIPPLQEVALPAIEPPVVVARESTFTRDSSPIDINEHIQRDIDANALTFQRWHDDLRVPATPIEPAEAGAETNAIHPAYTAADASDGPKTRSANEEREQHSAQEAAPDQHAVSWQELASFLAERESRRDADDEDAVATQAGDSTRLPRPERLQRPELPPVQRVRPVQRAAVLPPRIKPLAL